MKTSTSARGLAPLAKRVLALSTLVPSIALAQSSRIEQGQIFSSTLTNNLLGDSGTRPFSVYLPPSYEATQKRYPVVYALHGYGGTHKDMEAIQPALDSMTAAGTMGEMLVVFVSGTNRLWGCQYLSSPVIGDYETYLAKDLVAYIDAHYRTLATRNSRGITGVSMGGAGSMHLALKFPEVFGVVVPNAGYYDAVGDAAQYTWRLASQAPPTNLVQFDSLSFPLNWAQSLLAALLPDLQRPELYTDYPYALTNGQLVAVDTAMQRLREGDVQHGDLGRYTNQPDRLKAIKIVHGTNDNVVPISTARAFTDALTAAGLTFTYEEHPGGHMFVPELTFPFLSTNLQGAEFYFGPLITQQPQSQTNLVGTTATFTVTATGTLPLAYQWQRDTGLLDFSDLVGRTNTTLLLTNVAVSDGVNYRVVITNVDGVVTSTVAHLTVILAPRLPTITPTVWLQHQAADIGTRASFAVTASGAAPLTYQWRLDGQDLPGQTNRTITFSPVQPADEGDYTVVVANPAGAVTSAPVRLWATPPASTFIKANFTNSLGRLPYFYLLPTNYDATRSYPLYLKCEPADETGLMRNLTWPSEKVMSSYRQQKRDPVIQLWPSVRGGDTSWTEAYQSQTSTLLDQFIQQFHVDTNRIYVSGASMTVAIAWDTITAKPGFFAGALFAEGWRGANPPPAAVQEVPVWAWCAGDDSSSLVGTIQQGVRALRMAGGNVRYTEYAHGLYTDNTGNSWDAHASGIFMGWVTPAIVDWLLTQRRDLPSTAPPLLTITNPTAQTVWSTGATNLTLAGSALALDQDVTRVAWENTANKLTGIATGSNSWTIADLLLTANRTNIVIVTGTTASWAPASGGNTTFNDTLTVGCYPIRATLSLQATGAVLNWTGGGPPFRIQRATNLTIGDWTDFLSNATVPVILPTTSPCGFYRVVGQ